MGWLNTSGQSPLLSRFVGAFSPGWPTGTNDSGLKLVPVGPRTGTEEGPRGQARSEGGRGHWSRLIGRTGTKEAALFLIFFIYFIFCVLYSIKWYHIHIIKRNNEGTTIYITLSRIYHIYTPSHSSCLVEHVLHKRYTSHTSSIKIYIGP